MIFQLSFGPPHELPAAPLETPWDSWCTAPWAPGPPAPRPSVGAPPRSVPGGAFSNHFGIWFIYCLYIVYIQSYSSNILRNIFCYSILFDILIFVEIHRALLAMDVVPKTLKPSRKGTHIWRTTHLSISGWDETH